jgi:glutamyl-tRNA reductase
MSSQFRVLTISHKTAPLKIREQIALNEGESKALMLKINELFGISELLVLSTCNRTEVYFYAENDLSQNIIKTLAILKGVSSNEILPYFDIISEQEKAVRHIFEVSTGLHSQVVGDMQIPNQVKHAYQWSADAQMAGPFLHRLMHTIFFTNKKVAQETSFRDGAASTSYAVAELIESFVSTFPNPKILLVGLGEIGEDVCRNLVSKSIENITIINRTKEKAEVLAKALNSEKTKLQIADYQEVTQKINESSIVISAVRIENFITKNTLQNTENLTYKYFIDLSVPRSISAEIEELNGVVLYNIDEIQSRTNVALQKRMNAVPAVLNIISQAVDEFNDWSKEIVASPVIQKMKNALEQIRKEEMGRFIKEMTDVEAATIDKITANMIQKIIKLHVVPLKAACKRGEADTLVDVLNELFDLENSTQSESAIKH